MKKNVLGKTGIVVTDIGIGVLPMGPCQRNMDVSSGAEIIAYAVKHGITFIDTAEYYDTYRYISEACRMLTEDEKNSIVISTKSYAETYSDMMNAVDDALDKLDREYIDIFLMHEVRSGQFKEREGAWNALMDAKSEGKIRAIGVSTHHTDVVLEMAEKDSCDLVFGLVNRMGLGIRTGLTAEETADLSDKESRMTKLIHGCFDRSGTVEEMLHAISVLKKNGKGFYAMKAFGGGNLVSDYRNCLDFIYENPDIDSLFIGFSSIKDVDDYLSYRENKPFELDLKGKVLRVEKASCEGCGTCAKKCASKAISFDSDGLAEIDPAKCLTCGYCQKACPARAIIFY